MESIITSQLKSADTFGYLAAFLTTIAFLPQLLRTFKTDGSKVKVTDIETNNPTVIIQPKSIMGLMPLNINDKKAQIVVSTV